MSKKEIKHSPGTLHIDPKPAPRGFEVVIQGRPFGTKHEDPRDLFYVMNPTNTFGAGEQMAKENARRLCAVWNACEGLSTEALEAGALRDAELSAISLLHKVMTYCGPLTEKEIAKPVAALLAKYRTKLPTPSDR